jgi:hypothetical protein
MKILLMIAGLVLIAGAAFAMSDLYVSGIWRYKMTVMVETPEGIKTGSAVHEVSNSSSNVKILSFPEAGNPAEFRGEAVMVDLGKRGKLFVLVNTDSYRELYNAFPTSGPSTVEGIKYYNSLKIGELALLPKHAYPQMVTFANMHDPRTVKNIPINDLSAVFGKGVKLKEIKVEITDEPVTRGIEKYLPSYDQLGFQDWYNELPYGDPRHVHIYNFTAGEK